MRSDTTMVMHISADRSARRARLDPARLPRRHPVVHDARTARPRRATARHVQLGVRDRLGQRRRHGVGAAACTINTVEQNTGVSINHFVVVDFAGFQQMVDALGGVPMCIPNDMRVPARPASTSRPAPRRSTARRRSPSPGPARARASATARTPTASAASRSCSPRPCARCCRENLLTDPPKLLVVPQRGDRVAHRGQRLASIGDMTGLAFSLRSISSGNITFMTIPFAAAQVRPEPGRVDVRRPTPCGRTWPPTSRRSARRPPAPATTTPRAARRPRPAARWSRPPRARRADPGRDQEGRQGGVHAPTTRRTSAGMAVRRAGPRAPPAELRARRAGASRAPGRRASRSSVGRPSRPTAPARPARRRPRRAPAGGADASTRDRASGRPPTIAPAGQGARPRGASAPVEVPGRAGRPADARRPRRPAAPAVDVLAARRPAAPRQPIRPTAPRPSARRAEPGRRPPRTGRAAAAARRRRKRRRRRRRAPWCRRSARLADRPRRLGERQGPAHRRRSAAPRTPPAPPTCSTGSDSRGATAASARTAPRAPGPTRSCCCTSRRAGRTALISLPRDTYVEIPGQRRGTSSTPPSRGVGRRCSCRRSRG